MPVIVSGSVTVLEAVKAFHVNPRVSAQLNITGLAHISMIPILFITKFW